MPRFTTSVTGMVAICFALVSLTPPAATAAEERVSASPKEAAECRNEEVPMRDGVKLLIDLFLPKNKGPFPAILLRTPYTTALGELSDGVNKVGRDFGREFAALGYAFVLQDCRGTGRSQGIWRPWIRERDDGMDLHKWVLAQPWCNGKIATFGRELRDGDVESTTADLFHEARSYAGADIVKARMLMHASSRIMAEFQREYDVILTPTLATPPIRHGIISLSRPGFQWPDDILNFQPSLPLANWTGQPAMSVPLYWTEDDLPVGVHFLGRHGDEDTLFSLSAQLEKEKPWFDKRPRLH